MLSVSQITEWQDTGGLLVQGLFSNSEVSSIAKHFDKMRKKFVKNLTGAGLMNKIEYDGKHVFVITPKGKQYLESYKQFSDLAGTFGLEL